MALKGAYGAEIGHLLAEGLQGTGTYSTTAPNTGAREYAFTAGQYIRPSEPANGGDTGLAFSTTGILHASVFITAWTTDTSNTMTLIHFGGDVVLGAHVDENGVLGLGWHNGTNRIHVGTGTMQLALNTRYTIELIVTRTGSGHQFSAAELWVDGVQVSTWSGTSPSDAASQSNIYFAGNSWGAANGVFRVDDLVFYDNTGASMTTRQGPLKVYYLHPASDPGTSHANWTKPGGATTNRHTSVDNIPPVFETYDSTSGSAEDYLRNAPSSANSALNLTLQSYTAAGIASGQTIHGVVAYAVTGSSSATDTAGDIGLASNPAIAQTSFTAYDNGVASATVTTWRRQASTVAYAPSPTLGTGPVITLRKVTATTRVVLTNRLYAIAVAGPAGTAHSQPVNDSAAATDAQAKTVGKTLTEAPTVTDATTKTVAYVRTFDEALGVADTVAKAAAHPLADDVAATDAVAKTSGVNLTDAAAATDAAARTVGHVIAEAPTVADTIAKAVTVPLEDAVAAADASTRTVGRAIADSATATDQAAPTAEFTRTVEDAATVADTAVKAAGVTHADAVEVADEPTWTWDAVRTIDDSLTVEDSISTGGDVAHTKTFDEDLGVTDEVAKAATHPLADTATVADAVDTDHTSGQTDHVLELNDTVGVTDTVAKAVALPLADATATADAVAKTPGVGLAEAVTGSDTLAKTAAKTVADTATAADSVAKAFSTTRADALVVTDLVVADAVRAGVVVITAVSGAAHNITAQGRRHHIHAQADSSDTVTAVSGAGTRITAQGRRATTVS